MPNVEANQERGDLLHDARVLQFAAVDGAHAGNFGGQRSHCLAWRWGRHCRRSRRSQPAASPFRSSAEVLWNAATTETPLGTSSAVSLRGGALPDAESAGGAAANAGRQRHGGVDHDAAGSNRGLDLLEQGGVAFKRDGEHEQIGGGAGGDVFFTRNFCIAANSCLDFRGRVLSALGVARSDDHASHRRGPSAAPAQSLPDRCRRG